MKVRLIYKIIIHGLYINTIDTVSHIRLYSEVGLIWE